MQLKHRLKQFTAVALSCLSVISTPLTAYAVGGNTGSGDNEGIHGGYGSDMGSNRPNSRSEFQVNTYTTIPDSNKGCLVRHFHYDYGV